MEQAEKAEAMRPAGAYGDAVAVLDNVSLKTPGVSAGDEDVVHAILAVMVAELSLSTRRKERFTLFRAR